MVDISAIGALLSSLQALKDIGQAMVGLRDGAAFQAKLIEFQSKIIDANNSAFAAQEERRALTDEIQRLKQQIDALKSWEAEKQRYELRQMRDGVLAYALKLDIKTTDPGHWICPTCFERSLKSVLQLETRAPYRSHVYVCHACGTELYADGVRVPEHGAVRRPSKAR